MRLKTFFTGAVLLIVIVLAGIYFYFYRMQYSVVSSSKTSIPTFQENGLKLGDDIINCEFRTVSDYVYNNEKDPLSDEDRKVHYSTSDSKTPNLITFAGLSTEEPKIKGNNGDSPLAVIKNDDDSLVLIEKNAFGDMFVYTIFKQEKVAVWHKAYKLIKEPYALLSMGYCY